MKRLQSRQIVFFVVLLLAVTMPALVPGQQYTGVKSVSPASSSDNTEGEAKPSEQKGGATSSGISARSIDKFEANELPEGDSKIIKLDIKQFESKATSGSRGARNLGFSADVSLNSIPGGLNNELTSGDFKFPVTPPSAVAKDSYGNPVTPFADVGSTGLDAAGFVPDVSRDSLQGSSNNNQYSHLDFKLPSYASGIIQPVQLPSLSPGNFHSQKGQNQFDPQPTSTSRIPTTTPFQFVSNAKIPTIGDGQILFAQKPLNGLIPPAFPGEELPVYKVEVGTERSPIFARDPFASPTLDKGLTLPHNTPPVNFNQGSPQNPQVPLQVPLPLAPLPPQHTQTSQQPQFQSHQPSPQSHQVHQQPQFKPTQVPVQKFTGSFGGAPGLLGSQQNLGTAYTSTPKPVQSTAPQSYPTPPPTHVIPSIQQTSLPTKAPNKFTGSFGGAPGFLGNQQNLGTAYTSTPKPAQPFIPQSPPPQQTTHFAPPVHQAAHPTQPNKFTGSFGGTPGFLGNQQNPGTAYKPTTSNPSAPQGPITFQPAPPPTYQQPQQFPQTQAPSIVKPPSPFQPPTQQQHHRPGQTTGQKFTGSFGGAPGLLGNQQKPGTHVKPDGTFLPPSGPGLGGSGSPATSSGNVVHRPSTVVNSGSTFSGSFGGPPGVLRPYDNVKG